MLRSGRGAVGLLRELLWQQAMATRQSIISR